MASVGHRRHNATDAADAMDAIGSVDATHAMTLDGVRGGWGLVMVRREARMRAVGLGQWGGAAGTLLPLPCPRRCLADTDADTASLPCRCRCDIAPDST